MANLDLAQALAQQASGGGKKGRGGTAAGMVGATSTTATPVWEPLRLGRGFRVGDATASAVRKAAASMNKFLRGEGLVVNAPQGRVETPIEVAEARGGKVVRAYDEAEFLSMFAKQRQLNGVIVDGQA